MLKMLFIGYRCNCCAL